MDRVTFLAKQVCPEYGTNMCSVCSAVEAESTCMIRTTIERLLQLGYEITMPTKVGDNKKKFTFKEKIYDRKRSKNAL